MADDSTQAGQNDNGGQNRDRDQNGSNQAGGTPDSGAGYGNNAEDEVGNDKTADTGQ